MGSSCSHSSSFEVSNIDPEEYVDEFNIWKFIVADGICNDCNKKIRIKKKICAEHNIPQYWEFVDPQLCRHEVLMIRYKKRDIDTHRYNGRAECVACLSSVPVYTDFAVRKINESETVDVHTSDWEVDRKKLTLERKHDQNK